MKLKQILNLSGIVALILASISFILTVITGTPLEPISCITTGVLMVLIISDIEGKKKRRV